MVSLKELFERDFRYANWERDVKIRNDSPTWVNIAIFTDLHEYNISARYPSDDDLQGYLGCISTNRKTRAGEVHHRGSDLADGPYTEKTWRRILADIVSYELVKIM